MIRFVATCCCLILAFAARAEVTDVDNAELAKLAASGVPLIDVRTAPEWEQTGIVPGSHLLTFFDTRGNADPAAWLQKAKAVAKPGDPLIVICRSGNRSRAVSKFLSENAGYTKVYNVKNGILGWSKEGRPIASAAPVLAACRRARTC
ncbi:MAG: sulfurtransferase [Betaproteobacteria bacterium RIFCSPLOWO2_02_FULL_63_19]|nr:MAG: sulfurtransferase [Betaproteobacteria bacterium RIFCSPLOWO2_02_FULL_63_19]